jgi:hypothetical protein
MRNQAISLLALSALLAGTTSLAGASPRPASPARAAAGRKAAVEHVQGVHGGGWRATYRGTTEAGAVKVKVAAKSPLRRLFGDPATGALDVEVDDAGKGAVTRERMAAGRGKGWAKRAWNSDAGRTIRKAETVVKVVAAGVATFVATRLGLAVDQILPVVTTLTVAILGNDIRTRTRLRRAVDDAAIEIAADTAPSPGGAATHSRSPGPPSFQASSGGTPTETADEPGRSDEPRRAAEIAGKLRRKLDLD